MFPPDRTPALALALLKTWPMVHGYFRVLREKPNQPSYKFYFETRDRVGLAIAAIFEYYFIHTHMCDGKYWYEWTFSNTEEGDADALRYVKLRF